MLAIGNVPLPGGRSQGAILARVPACLLGQDRRARILSAALHQISSPFTCTSCPHACDAASCMPRATSWLCLPPSDPVMMPSCCRFITRIHLFLQPSWPILGTAGCVLFVTCYLLARRRAAKNPFFPPKKPTSSPVSGRLSQAGMLGDTVACPRPPVPLCTGGNECDQAGWTQGAGDV